MSDWKFLNGVRCGSGDRNVPPQYWSDESFGFNGMFRFWFNGKPLRCLASDGMGWQHVSVSIEGDKRCPSWDIMCYIKSLFWEPEDVVVQFHPAESEYVNYHSGCLHLWRCTDGRQFPTPRAMMVGPK